MKQQAEHIKDRGIMNICNFSRRSVYQRMAAVISAALETKRPVRHYDLLTKGNERSLWQREIVRRRICFNSL